MRRPPLHFLNPSHGERIMAGARAGCSGWRLPTIRAEQAELQKQFKWLCSEFAKTQDVGDHEQAIRVGDRLLDLIETEKNILLEAK